jgi:NAD(P)-dependent dehydrogenase (short-subunit alcohol dehydrogenase family)
LVNCAGDAAPTGGIADTDLERFNGTLAVRLGGHHRGNETRRGR